MVPLHYSGQQHSPSTSYVNNPLIINCITLFAHCFAGNIHFSGNTFRSQYEFPVCTGAAMLYKNCKSSLSTEISFFKHGNQEDPLGCQKMSANSPDKNSLAHGRLDRLFDSTNTVSTEPKPSTTSVRRGPYLPSHPLALSQVATVFLL